MAESRNPSNAIALTCSILTGWNIGLIVGLYALIGAAVAIGPFDVASLSFAAVAVFTLALALGSGTIAGSYTRRWYRSIRPGFRYFWLVTLVGLTVISFPGRFYYTVP